MSQEALNALTNFLNRTGAEDVHHMSMDFSVSPPVLVFNDEKRFVALDPAGSKFYIDPNFQFGFEYDFSRDPVIQTKVDQWGKHVWDKAKSVHMQNWIDSTNS